MMQFMASDASMFGEWVLHLQAAVAAVPKVLHRAMLMVSLLTCSSLRAKKLHSRRDIEEQAPQALRAARTTSTLLVSTALHAEQIVSSVLHVPVSQAC